MEAVELAAVQQAQLTEAVAALPNWMASFKIDGPVSELREQHRSQWIAYYASLKPVVVSEVNEDGVVVVIAKAERLCRTCNVVLDAPQGRGRPSVLCPSCKANPPVATPKVKDTATKVKQPTAAKPAKVVSDTNCRICGTVIPHEIRRGRPSRVCKSCK